MKRSKDKGRAGRAFSLRSGRTGDKREDADTEDRGRRKPRREGRLSLTSFWDAVDGVEPRRV